jgi:hypothetical protein
MLFFIDWMSDRRADSRLDVATGVTGASRDNELKWPNKKGSQFGAAQKVWSNSGQSMRLREQERNAIAKENEANMAAKENPGESERH